MSLTFALIGNQNCGKTTLFNRLTGSNQHVGNFPGVTVEKKEGPVKKHKNLTVVDLPGIYSLSAYSSEEIVTRDFLIQEKPDGIINIVDATNIERNLYLSLQLMELNIPMVIALNMMDEIESSGNSIDVLTLEKELGLPVIPISASKNAGIEDLIKRAVLTVKNRAVPKKMDFCTGPVHRAIHSIAHIIEQKALKIGVPVRFAATKLVEGDEPMQKSLGLTDNEADILGHIVDEMEKELGTDREAALADMRYDYIEQICALAVTKVCETREQVRSDKIDRVLTHKVFAIPIFIVIMFVIFWLTFSVIGSFLSDLLSAGIDSLTAMADAGLGNAEVNDWLHSLIIDGVFAGVGSVLSFLPIIVVLFFFLSMLEDTGYMARIAFVLDKLLRKIGLSGRSFVPLLLGFGCSVPAIMATRTLSSERDRRMTVILTPFMSCSAKLPIYAVFISAFFAENRALMLILIYVLGMIMVILAGLFLKSTVFKGNPIPFVLELPCYRMPSLSNVVINMWQKASDFLTRAFTIIFISSIVIWFLQTMDFRFNVVQDSGSSMLAAIGKLISPIFAPLGFGDWRASTALITGLAAKEAVASTLAVLSGAGSAMSLTSALTQIFSPLSAFSFLCFTLLYMPCFAALAATRREIGTVKGTAFAMFFQTATAWVVAFIVFNLGRLIGF